MFNRWGALVLAFGMAGMGTPALAMTAAEMCQIIRADIFEYRAKGRPCPCPYSTLASGTQCGNRAAWAKPDGRVPRCYFRDVTGERPPNRRPNPVRQTWPEPPECVPTS
jgi:hypothetical protein